MLFGAKGGGGQPWTKVALSPVRERGFREGQWATCWRLTAAWRVPVSGSLGSIPCPSLPRSPLHLPSLPLSLQHLHLLL